MVGLIIEKKPRSPISEAYRTVRTNIEFSSIDIEIKKILITSAGPGETKSHTAANLALAFAQSGKKTLLIDGDLRKPTIYKLFNVSNRLGLSNIIVEGVNLNNIDSVTIGGLSVYETINHYNDKLDIITCGTVPPNPSEIVGSNKMRILLEKLSSKYDRIIIDAPPVMAVTDAQLLSTMVDGVIMVVASEITNKEAAKRAKELLERVKANILGVVLTRVKKKNNKYGFDGYYQYDNIDKKKKKRKRK